MKKIILISLLFVIFANFLFSINTIDRVKLGFIKSSDDDYIKVYGKNSIYIEAQKGIKFYGDYYLFFSFGYSMDSGESYPFELSKTDVKRFFPSLGIGIEDDILSFLSYYVEVSIGYMFFRETAFSKTNTGNTPAIKGEVGLEIYLWKKVSIGIGTSYQDKRLESSGCSPLLGGHRFFLLLTYK